ncbi:MAG: hypothetical protein EPN79_15885 [Burkholderiaceae bacterium]|nr:MAG: hypothetical protein EPN79_15885 [Burkholderiaceae bacterium]
MAKAADDTDGDRRIQLRLTPHRLDHAEFLAALDQRSEFAGKTDQEWLRRCLLTGFAILSNAASNNETLAAYSNKSHHTVTTTAAADTSTAAVVAQPAPIESPDAGGGVRALMGMLGKAQELEREVKA